MFPTMSQDGQRRYEGGRHEGPDHASPYPVSRLAPVHDLVDIAAEIQKADAVLGTVATSQLAVIAEQIRSLQAKARTVLERARKDAELHRARCSFEKKAGQTYHLYRRDDGVTYFSLLGPDEWRLPQPQTFVGSYRLELDMSFTPLTEVAARDAEHESLRSL